MDFGICPIKARKQSRNGNSRLGSSKVLSESTCFDDENLIVNSVGEDLSCEDENNESRTTHLLEGDDGQLNDLFIRRELSG